MRPSVRLGLAAALLAASAAPALAQGSYQSGYGQQGYDAQRYPPSTYDRSVRPYDQGAPSRPSDRDGRYDQGPGPGQGQDDPQELARRLNLTSGQQGAFDAYRRAFAPDEARSRQEEDEMRRMATLTTPQRLDAARAALARDRADFDRTDAATRAFYAQLSPAQRRTFDQLTAPQEDDEGGPEGNGPSPTQPTARPPR